MGEAWFSGAGRFFGLYFRLSHCSVVTVISTSISLGVCIVSEVQSITTLVGSMATCRQVLEQ